MPGPRPGSNAYDVERARLRKRIDNSGRRANDSKADDAANRHLQEDGRRGFVRGERGLGPKAERGPGEPK
ncbi:phosphatidylethanolamine-binding protein [Plantactinospora sp. B6F1]|uniref:phosphatidylethanolamine-binding protein n=1 Tax=Plantactinospora sp. B6F1 TaxID=3158971 RepID=UPI00102D09EA